MWGSVYKVRLGTVESDGSDLWICSNSLYHTISFLVYRKKSYWMVKPWGAGGLEEVHGGIKEPSIMKIGDSVTKMDKITNGMKTQNLKHKAEIPGDLIHDG